MPKKLKNIPTSISGIDLYEAISMCSKKLFSLGLFLVLNLISSIISLYKAFKIIIPSWIPITLIPT